MALTLVDRTDDDGNRIKVTASPEVAKRLGKQKQAEAFTPEETGESIAANQLKSLVKRIERLEEEKKTIAEDIKEVYAEAKSNGYDAKVLRKVVAIRKRDLRERREEEAILDLYLHAVGESA
jgi:uncharacterized protein (UPF0335 family)